MNFIKNIFSSKNGINEKLKTINLLRVTNKGRQANDEISSLIKDLMSSPKAINDINNLGEFGNLLTNLLNNFNQNDELQFIVEIAFYAISKGLVKDTSPHGLYDRIIVMYNGEDFLKETIRQSQGLEYNPLSRLGSRHMINHQVDDLLMKMRYHDLVSENRFWRNGENGNDFNKGQLIELTNQINGGYFGENIGVKEVELEGKKLINKTFQFIAEKYSSVV